jgi:peptide/nickel transport system ATP-binding protein
VWFDGIDLVTASAPAMRDVRGKRISLIQQEPMTSLNPVLTVGDQIGESLRLHAGLNAADARSRAIEMLQQVGIPAPERRVDEYPHQMSGGMRQRVMIAMALACRPDILIADEPTTALDVTVQAQIFDLLRDLQRKKGTAILLITHDMGAVAEMADRVMVMYAGRVIEQGTTAQVLGNPGHPYTCGLIACLPELGSSADAATDSDRIELAEITGVVPSIWELGSGCAFRERCPHAMPRCTQEVPPMFSMDDGATHGAACWLHAEEVAA